ncbi:MAG: Uncharacterised protein [SAR116 cluster bacterium]|nr:MAG: Uncharacterised protein [SAR116 cluster bacterium]
MFCTGQWCNGRNIGPCANHHRAITRLKQNATYLATIGKDVVRPFDLYRNIAKTRSQFRPHRQRCHKRQAKPVTRINGRAQQD